MGPAALMLSLIAVIPTVEVRAQHSLERRTKTKYAFGYFSRPAPPVLVVTLTLWRGETPHVAVLTFFSPYRLICMHHRAAAYPLSYGCCRSREEWSLGYCVQQPHDLSGGDGKGVNCIQVLSYEAHRHTHTGAQVSNERS